MTGPETCGIRHPQQRVAELHLEQWAARRRRTGIMGGRYRVVMVTRHADGLRRSAAVWHCVCEGAR